MVSSSVIFEYFCAECTDGKWIAEKRDDAEQVTNLYILFKETSMNSGTINQDMTTIIIHFLVVTYHLERHTYTLTPRPREPPSVYLPSQWKWRRLKIMEAGGFLSSFACLFVVPYPGSLPQLASVFWLHASQGPTAWWKRWWGELFEASTPWLRTPWFFSDTWLTWQSRSKWPFHCFRAWVCAVGMPRMSRWFLPADGILGCFGMFLC